MAGDRIPSPVTRQPSAVSRHPSPVTRHLSPSSPMSTSVIALVFVAANLLAIALEAVSLWAVARLEWIAPALLGEPSEAEPWGPARRNG